PWGIGDTLIVHQQKRRTWVRLFCCIEQGREPVKGFARAVGDALRGAPWGIGDTLIVHQQKRRTWVRLFCCIAQGREPVKGFAREKNIFNAYLPRPFLQKTSFFVLSSPRKV
ncbi:MAG: hypothetical protein IJD77_02945, partial [Clostridia bacterium]|nr:hypothetical protein [Clostridia bacterium]